MSNKAKLALFLVFAVLTFYQFYTFARSFNLNDMLPKETNNATVLYGGQDVAISSSTRFNFDSSIFLLALNIILWVERPNRIRRAPLILAFIANLAIVIIRVGIAAPALNLAKAAAQNNTQNIWELVNLHTKWNAIYLIPATISALIVLSIGFQFMRNRRSFGVI